MVSRNCIITVCTIAKQSSSVFQQELVNTVTGVCNKLSIPGEGGGLMVGLGLGRGRGCFTSYRWVFLLAHTSENVHLFFGQVFSETV